MIIIIGAIIVMALRLRRLRLGRRPPGRLMHLNELVIIAGGAVGAMVIMSPRKVLHGPLQGLLDCLKGAPYSRAAYDELLKVLYELFMLGRRNGMIALEEHVLEPREQLHLQQISHLLRQKPPPWNSSAAASARSSTAKSSPTSLSSCWTSSSMPWKMEHHAPVNVLTKAADAMPGFGIVAAVLGIVITMASIAGPIEQIGEKVAAALVGTFLGIFLSYGFMNPLAMNLEFIGARRAGLTPVASPPASSASPTAWRPSRPSNWAAAAWAATCGPPPRRLEQMLKVAQEPRPRPDPHEQEHRAVITAAPGKWPTPTSSRP